MSINLDRYRILAPLRWTFIFLFSLLTVQKGLGQIAGSIPDLAVELSPRAFYDFENDRYYGQFMYSRIASALQLDPDAKGTGLARTAILSAGARSADLSYFEFRWRVGVIDMDLIRTPISMGLTLIDYDKSGFLELDVKWVNLRLGPSIYVGNERSFFALRAVGVGGLTTTKLGTFDYPGLGTTEDLMTRKRSYEIGYLGDMRVLLGNVFSIETTFQYRNQLGGLRPNIYQARGYMGIRFSENFSILATFLAEEVRAGSSTIRRQGVGLYLGFVY